jgi:hypothetical protein
MIFNLNSSTIDQNLNAIENFYVWSNIELIGNLAIAAKYCKKLGDLGVEYALIGSKYNNTNVDVRCNHLFFHELMDYTY